MKRFKFDPGHGGSDPGAVGFNLEEANVVLNLCTKTGNYILQHYEGVAISYTRTSDVYVSLDQRTDMANKEKVDFFYSFHNNAFGKSSANGFESFVYTDASSASVAYQNVIHGEIMQFLKKHGINDRGKKRGNLHIVRETKMPAILTEYLFISNKKENDLLKNELFINGLAEATGKAIAKATGLKPKSAAPIIKKAVAKKLYKVQVGAFEEKANADRLVKELESKGYKPFVKEE
jgi:N-acetylmuramoyl-L-alanine amidase